MSNISKKKVKILVADDYKPLHKIIHLHFKEFVSEIDTAHDGADALEFIEKNGLDYDLLILDIMMPVVNGFEVCTKVREKYSLFELPILIVTAKKDVDDIVKGFDVGANDYLSKPFERSELLARSKTLIRLKRLTKANDVLSQAVNLKNQFIRMNIHDLKNPLTTISLNAEMLSNEQKYDEESVSLISSAATHMLRLVNEILEISKIDSGKYSLLRENFDIAELVELVVLNNVKKANIKDQNLQFRKNNEKILINADKDKVYQIIENLISNAIKYSPVGRNIFIHVKKNKMKFSNSFVRVEVIDEGPGFSDEDMKKVFSRFQKLSAKPTANEPSSGLGLSIAYELAKMHDAKLWIESEKGKGAKFVFEIITVKE